MAIITLRIVRDAATGRQDLVVELAVDPDELPHEHEARHRAIVDQLMKRGIVPPGGAIRIERVATEWPTTLPQSVGAEPVARALPAGESG